MFGIKTRLKRAFAPKPRTIDQLSIDELVAQSLPNNHDAARAAYNRTGIAFIHIPKNAGSSVEQAIYGGKLGHRTWAEIQALDPSNNWLKFAVIRDPIDRFLSAYDYLSQGGRNPLDAEFARRFVIGKSADEMALSLSPEAMRWFHFRPQSDYVCEGVDLIRLEDLPEGLPVPVKLEHLNKTAGDRTDRSVLSARASNNLHLVYARDLELCFRSSGRFQNRSGSQCPLRYRPNRKPPS